MTARTRRTRNDPPKLVLTREPMWTFFAGKDANGEPWMGMDATKNPQTCWLCGEQFKYGYAPWSNTFERALCVKCVEFVEQEDAR